jgi:signal peptidase I
VPDLPPTTPPPAVAPSAGPSPRRGGRDRGLIVAGVIAAILVVLALLAIIAVNEERPLPTLGPSMKPTLAGRASVEVDSAAYERALPRRGDIVVVQAPQGYQGGCGVQSRFAPTCPDSEGYSMDRLVKRIVGVPGDEIGFDADGVVVRDGVRQNETSVRRCARVVCSMKPMRLGPDRYFLAGDNRPVSADSRLFGPVPLESIDGRVSLPGQAGPPEQS